MQARAVRFFLGVNKFAPILGIEGEMGWEPAEIRRKRQMLTFWNIIIGMDDSLLTRNIFEQDYDICKAKWSSKIYCILNSVNKQKYIEDKTLIDIEEINLLLTNKYKLNWSEKN